MRLLLDRREWLRIGPLAGTLGVLPHLHAAPDRRHVQGVPARAKSVLVVFTGGGMSQLDTWDPKPHAPEEIRGSFGTIPTSIPGVRFGEHLPHTAKRAHRMTIVKSMTHDDLDHGSAIYYSLTGVPHQRKSSNPPIRPTDAPCAGAILSRVGHRGRFPFSAAHVNGPIMAPRSPSAGQNAGFLGAKYEPLVVGNVNDPDDSFQGVEPADNLPTARLRSRETLLGHLDQAQTIRPSTSAEGNYTDQMRQAFDLLQSTSFRKVFDLEQEAPKLRDRYGRYRTGQACLLARRMVEAGVPWVTMFMNHGIRGQDVSDETDDYGWDTHNDIFYALREQLLPRFDWTFSALLDDLQERGLLETTLVICMGEFGRSPLVAVEKNFAGSSPGRKHWGGCYSVAFAGAGVTPGAVYGASDRIGAYPSSNPHAPPDILATAFAALGVDPGGHFVDRLGRPYPICTGSAIKGLFD